MTYCVAISVNDGLVLCSDSRTNAGPDMISTHSKMHIFKPAPGRLFTILTAGNLATTQAIISRIEHDLEDPDAKTNLATVTKMVEAARYVSRVNREEQAHAQASTASAGVDTSASLILGGQIAGGQPAIYLLYAAGNFITDSDENPFLQIGESKYGKPILDRILTRQTTLGDAARCVLVSMDSTIKSNATVGPPIEVLIYEKDSFDSDHFVRLGEDDHYLHQIRQRWNEALKSAFAELPQFEWEKRGHRSPSNVLSINPDVQK
ncbi:MAG: peptidase [Gammaproteobacteria bacterium]|nr:peptidase [Gammaproteobacteria bacterium]